jgi:hypothetical protein
VLKIRRYPGIFVNRMRLFLKYVGKIQVSVKSDKNNGYFTLTRFVIFDDISLNFS